MERLKEENGKLEKWKNIKIRTGLKEIREGSKDNKDNNDNNGRIKTNQEENRKEVDDDNNKWKDWMM